jgi:ATP adenylyltransferase
MTFPPKTVTPAIRGEWMMTYSDLKIFLTTKMRMSHIYQPLLIKGLIEVGGTATIRQMATIFLSQDESQIEYYEKRLKEMPIKVLSKHGVIEKKDDLIRLRTEKLTFKQKAELLSLCEQKLQEYVMSRGLDIWEYRFLDADQISGSLRNRVLKEAKGRCALCGISIKDRPMDVDHIIPRSKGGKTTYENLQVLCSKCNRAKGNKDDTDYRKNIEKTFDSNCEFCKVQKTKRVIDSCSNDLAFAILDKYPVNSGHTLIIPNRHTKDYFSLSKIEVEAVNELLYIRRKQLLEKNSGVEGFNVGVNIGGVAGQTIFHCHVHLIPRYEGDIPNPRGGVRGVIPGKMNY